MMEGAERNMLEDKLESEVLLIIFFLTDCHQEEDAGMRNTTKILQLLFGRLLLDGHLGQVPHLPDHPPYILILVIINLENHSIPQQLKQLVKISNKYQVCETK